MRRIALIFGVVAMVGCHDASSPTGPKGDPYPAPSSAEKAADQARLNPLVMPQKPEKVLSVRDVLTKKEGDKVLLSGQVPPAILKPFNAAVAAVLLMAPEDLEDKEIKEEFQCEDAATCPACKAILDAHAIRVELVDASGAVVQTSLEDFRGLKPGSTITIEGEVKREGKDKKLVRVVAKKFYPG